MSFSAPRLSINFVENRQVWRDCPRMIDFDLTGKPQHRVFHPSFMLVSRLRRKRCAKLLEVMESNEKLAIGSGSVG